MTTTHLTAPDITCGGCANAIRRALRGVPGVENVAVDVAQKTVAVQHEESVTPRQTVLAALERAGFPAAPTAAPAAGAGEETPSSGCHV